MNGKQFSAWLRDQGLPILLPALPPKTFAAWLLKSSCPINPAQRTVLFHIATKEEK